MSTKVYGVSITTFKINLNSALMMTDESTLENVYLSAEAAEEYGNKVFEDRIKVLNNKEERTSKHGCKFIDPETGNRFLIHYEVFALNLIKSEP